MTPIPAEGACFNIHPSSFILFALFLLIMFTVAGIIRARARYSRLER